MQLTAVTIPLYMFVTLLPYNTLGLLITDPGIPGWERAAVSSRRRSSRRRSSRRRRNPTPAGWESCCNGKFTPGDCNAGGKTDCKCVGDDQHELLSSLIKDWESLGPTVPEVREEFRGMRILFVGSSTTRRLMYAFDAALQDKVFTDRYGAVHDTVECPDRDEFANEDATLKEHAISFEFRWAPLIADVLQEVEHIEKKHENWDFIITNTLLHELDGHANLSGEAAALKWEALNDIVISNRFLLTTENLAPTSTFKNKFIMDYIAQLRKQCFIQSKVRWLDTSSWMLQSEQSFDRHPCLTFQYDSPHINNHHGQMLRVAQILPVIRAWRRW